jgi:hypothetical protein
VIARRLKLEERRAIATALRLQAGNALQVAASWDPATGVIPKAVGAVGAEEVRQSMLVIAHDAGRLASEIIESEVDLLPMGARPPHEVTPAECPNCCKRCGYCGTACRC